MLSGDKYFVVNILTEQNPLLELCQEVLPDSWNDFLDQMFSLVLEMKNSLVFKPPGKNYISVAVWVIGGPEQKEHCLTI